MKEDLHLYGNERNWLGTWFSLGIMVGSIPAQMSQLRFVRPSILIPSCELIWAMLVMGMGFVKDIKTVSGTLILYTSLLILQDVRAPILHRTF